MNKGTQERMVHLKPRRLARDNMGRSIATSRVGPVIPEFISCLLRSLCVERTMIKKLGQQLVARTSHAGLKLATLAWN